MFVLSIIACVFVRRTAANERDRAPWRRCIATPSLGPEGFREGKRGITRFSVETAGAFDRDAELKIWLSGTPAPLQLQFNKKLNIYEVQAVQLR